MNMDPWQVFITNFGTMPMPYTAFVTLLDVVLFFVVSLNVGFARKKYNI